MLEKILDSYPKPKMRFQRQITLKLPSLACLYGPNGIGKTDFVLHYFLKPQFNTSKKLYIDCNDTRLSLPKDLEKLKQFVKEHNISILILDNYHKNPIFLDFTLPFIVLISNAPYTGFQNISMPPITFSEFLSMRKLSREDGLAQYLKFGNLFEHFSEQKKGEFLRTIAQDSTEFWMLRNLILHLGQKVSPYQIYTKLKKEGRLSKDRFYAYTQALEKSRILFWVEKFEHASAPKKLYFWDFTLKNAVSYDRNFALLFENMVFLELLFYFKFEFFYTDKLDFYIPSLSLGIICSPFVQTLELRLNKIGKEREFCDSLLILSLNHYESGENLGTPYTIIPFAEFSQNGVSLLKSLNLPCDSF
ncbi:ATP-binding protein [Helicobacter turcicus]|uniref:ATP-binding protein n=1 Tax=Helicobacter turcicus TaxID=2867412 RepID=A0ABS7JNH2_9HELI|nr:ATP-binding protein [Helicobacter turcicus]MBX7490932.1 ATP-binding protein [Helicobacter turcicus]MBX7545786.1 ATP-binding protein [Helicobacter turcicus]